MNFGWRSAALGGLAAGLACAPGSAAGPLSRLALGLVALALVAAALSRRSGEVLSVCSALLSVGLAAAAAGLVLGDLRLGQIEGGALRSEPGQAVELSGTLASHPRRSAGEVRFELDTGRGRLTVFAPEPVPRIGLGATVAVTGGLESAPDWYRAQMRRAGSAMVLRAERVDVSEGGGASPIGRLRSRAEHSLTDGLPAREAALALGFVLGQDDRIDPATLEDFRRSGLAHLLAVSGQNVMLLVLLATLPLAVLGVPLRRRVPVLLVLIAIYVPLTGAGASIQRAGVMGAAGLLALLAGRPSSRLFAVLAAAVVTLALNPLATGDIGWQLSFAAVIGILLLAPGLRREFVAVTGPGRVRGLLAEGLAITMAATLATGPLIAHHFEQVPVASLSANLLALPAVAPAMWLGMCSVAAGLVPGLPTEPINLLNAVALAYIAEVAGAVAGPDWAVLEVRISLAVALVATGMSLATFGATLRWAGSGRRGKREASPESRNATAGRAARRRQVPGSFGRLACLLLIGCLVLAPVLPSLVRQLPGGGATPPQGLRITALDVGQGDAILLQQAEAAGVLIDTGPRDGRLVAGLERAGVERLAAVVLTHNDSDHSGGLAELLASIPVGVLLHGAPLTEQLTGGLAAAGVPSRAVQDGVALTLGRLGLEVLWPPGGIGAAAMAAEPNRYSVVLLSRWPGHRALFAGDAEAEQVPLEPGDIDLLKVSHHGSEDDGLEALLQRSRPELALISAGSENRFGHPAAPTLDTLAGHGVEVRRTDQEGDLVLELPPAPTLGG